MEDDCEMSVDVAIELNVAIYCDSEATGHESSVEKNVYGGGNMLGIRNWEAGCG